MKKFAAVLSLSAALLFSTALSAVEKHDEDGWKQLSDQRYTALSDELKTPQNERVKGWITRFAQEADYGKRRKIVDELLYTFTGAEYVAPDSRKPSSLKKNPMDARQLVTLEYFSGPYHNRHWEHDEPQNPRPGAAAILKQGYQDLADYVYQRLRQNDKAFDQLLSGVVLTYKHERQDWEVDVSKAGDFLEKTADFTDGAVLRQDLEKCIKDNDILLEKIGAAFQQYAGSVPDSPWYEWYRSFGKNKPLITMEDDIIAGTEKNDRINGYDGNDKIYGRGGDDTLNGGEGNDYLEGGEGNDTYYFEPGWGKDEINNCASSAGEKDAIVFAEGIKAENVRLLRRENNLILRYADSEYQITIKDFFARPECRISGVRFAGGEVWSAETLGKEYPYWDYVWEEIKKAAYGIWDKIGALTEGMIYKIITWFN